MLEAQGIDNTIEKRFLVFNKRFGVNGILRSVNATIKLLPKPKTCPIQNCKCLRVGKILTQPDHADHQPAQRRRRRGEKAIVEETATGSRYVVRRLTPSECALLQGFPPDWCARLETKEPTEEEIAFWSGVWETRRILMGTSTKPKSRNQIIKWLNAP